MSVVTVRNLDDETRDRLKAQAKRHGRSMESEARAILTAAVSPSSEPQGGLGSRIAGLFAGVDSSGLELDRTHEPARAAVFDT